MLALLPLAACCQTTLVGGRVPRGDGSQARKLEGFPFALTKPEFVLTRDDKGIDALAVAWVPDLEHVYTLRLDPSRIADSRFALELNANGSLKGVSTSSVENVTPTLKVIGQIAASVIGLKSVGPSNDLVEAFQQDKMKALGLTASDQQAKEATERELRALWQELEDPEEFPFIVRMRAMQADGYIWDEAWLPQIDAAAATHDYCESKSLGDKHWRKASTDEKAKLSALVQNLSDANGQQVPWSTFELAWFATAARLAECEAAEVAKLRASIPPVLGELHEQQLNPLQAGAADPCQALWTLAIRLRLVAQPGACDVTSLVRLDATAAAREKRLLLESATRAALLELSDNVRRRRIEAIEARIEELRRIDATKLVVVPDPANPPPAAPTPDDEIARLERAWAIAIGAYEEYELQEKLLEVLRTSVRPNLGERPQAEAVRDYDRARLQLVEVRRTMTEKRSKFRTPLPKALPLPRNEVVREESFDAVAKGAGLTPDELRQLLDKGDSSSPVVLAALNTLRKPGQRFVVIRQKRPVQEGQ